MDLLPIFVPWPAMLLVLLRHSTSGLIMAMVDEWWHVVARGGYRIMMACANGYPQMYILVLVHFKHGQPQSGQVQGCGLQTVVDPMVSDEWDTSQSSSYPVMACHGYFQAGNQQATWGHAI